MTATRQTVLAVGLALAVYAGFLPAALWGARAYVPPPRPDGAVVEVILKVEHRRGHAYRAQTFALSRYAVAGEPTKCPGIVIYENLTPLGPGCSEPEQIENVGLGRFVHGKAATRPDSWRFVTFSTSDNSDPRTNGRIYWAVLPN